MLKKIETQCHLWCIPKLYWFAKVPCSSMIFSHKRLPMLMQNELFLRWEEQYTNELNYIELWDSQNLVHVVPLNFAHLCVVPCSINESEWSFAPSAADF